MITDYNFELIAHHKSLSNPLLDYEWDVVLLVSQRAPSTVRVIGSFTFLTRRVLAAVLDHHLHQLWNKNQNFEWHLEITKMNGHPKKASQLFYNIHIYVCVNWEIFLWSDWKFCLPWVLGGRGVPRSISGLPLPHNISSKSAHDKPVYNLASHIQ